jgi:hypothetical protein
MPALSSSQNYQQVQNSGMHMPYMGQGQMGGMISENQHLIPGSAGGSKRTCHNIVDYQANMMDP